VENSLNNYFTGLKNKFAAFAIEKICPLINHIENSEIN
jgi:hypothetical protein